MDGRVPITPTTRNETTPKRITPITPSRTARQEPNLKDAMLKEFGLDSDKGKIIPSQSFSHAHISNQTSPGTKNVQGQTVNNQTTVQPTSQTTIQPTKQHSAKKSPVDSTPQNTATRPQNAKIYYSSEEITTMLAGGYINIMREVWEFLPVGSHVRFFKKVGATRNERFRPGGFIKKQYETSEGKKILLMETIRNGNTNMADYFTYPMAYDDLAEIWKRYPEECFVEIHLIYGSLAKKNKQLSDLEARVSALESKFKK